jgi:hypothetical protein
VLYEPPRTTALVPVQVRRRRRDGR